MMLTRRARLQRQAQWDREDRADQQQRPNVPPRVIPLKDQCPGALGRAHDYSMGGRCWYCAQPKPEA
jgi:hypothetical protein